MTFSEILERVGSLGPFQILHVLLLSLPVFFMASHNLLQIFTAATPSHHCIPAHNASSPASALPRGPDGTPDRCRRFAHPLLERAPGPWNTTLPNETWSRTEPCLDGWVYDRSLFSSTIVTEENEGLRSIRSPHLGRLLLSSSLGPFPWPSSLHFSLASSPNPIR